VRFKTKEHPEHAHEIAESHDEEAQLGHFQNITNYKEV